MSTLLIDEKKQRMEMITTNIVFIISLLALLATSFKIILIFIYFFVIQALPGFFSFLIKLCKMKANFSVNFKNGCHYLFHILIRIYKFNFYYYKSIFVSFVFVFTFLLFLLSSTLFESINYLNITETEKGLKFLIYFYLSFESHLLLLILCSCFYTSRNMFKQTVISIFIFIIINLIILTAYFLVKKIEDINGCFINSEPQLTLNILINSLFLLLNTKALITVLRYNFQKESFNLLFEGKNKLVEEINEGKEAPGLEQKRIGKISEALKLKRIYYGELDNDFFNKKDRFNKKKRLLVVYVSLCIYNLYEIAYYIYLLSFVTKKTANNLIFDYDNNDKNLILSAKLMEILKFCAMVSLSCWTCTKLSIKSYTYY